jgi:hypothetical protein
MKRHCSRSISRSISSLCLTLALLSGDLSPATANPVAAFAHNLGAARRTAAVSMPPAVQAERERLQQLAQTFGLPKHVSAWGDGITIFDGNGAPYDYMPSSQTASNDLYVPPSGLFRTYVAGCAQNEALVA